MYFASLTKSMRDLWLYWTILGILKALFSRQWLQHRKWRSTYPGKRKLLFKIKKRKVKIKSPQYKLKKYVFTGPGNWQLQHLYLKINSGLHARENPSEAIISESSQIRELYETIINF